MGESIVTRDGRWGRTFTVNGGVEASGAQAKKQGERVVDKHEETTRRWKTLNGGKGEIRASALRVVIIINLSGV